MASGLTPPSQHAFPTCSMIDQLVTKEKYGPSRNIDRALTCVCTADQPFPSVVGLIKTKIIMEHGLTLERDFLAGRSGTTSPESTD